MTSFINVDLSGKTNYKFLSLHLLFTTIWLLSFLIFICRVDMHAMAHFNENVRWITGIIPALLFITVLSVIIVSKWYYSVALLFYPILALFWFIPKFILKNGKLYLLCQYAEGIVMKFTNFKLFITHIGILLLTLILFFISDNFWIKSLGIIVFTYFYFRYIFNYLSKSIREPQLFGKSIDELLEQLIQKDINKSFLLDAYIIQKDDEKLTQIELRNQRLTRLALSNFGLEYLSKNISGFNGKRAFVISWIYQLFVCIIFSLIYFTFINYQLYKIDNSNFTINEVPSIFNFGYYTLKCITFGGVDTLKPVSSYAKSVEIITYLLVGILLLLVCVSIFFSVKQDKITSNIQITSNVCKKQNELILQYLQDEYGTDISNVKNEITSISKSVENIKKIIDTIL